MSLLMKKDFGGSMVELQKFDQPEKETKGLLRRAFSSRRRKKKTTSGGSLYRGSPSLSPGPHLLSPRELMPPSPRFGSKETVHRVRSNPFSGGFPPSPDGSPASDLAARRGVFSRRHYGSVELLISTDSNGTSQTVGRFRIETGEHEREEVFSPMHSPIHLENPEFQTRWYFKYFLGKLHQNYIGADSDKEPFFLSVVLTDANNHNVPQYRAILCRKTGNQKICLPYNPSKPMTVKGILSHFDVNKTEKGPKEIFNREIQKELLVLEEQEGSVNFKFGVLFAKEGQTSDDEMYSNEKGSEQFEKFYRLLGDEVKLKGWEKYKGGLDTKSDTTGTKSIYTVYEGHEVMFHVSTLLPYSKDNKQQVERKRHIGNDIVNIVFIECNSDSDKMPSFKPSMMKTHFTHIYAVVAYNKENSSYRLNVYSEDSVPLFGPPLPCPPAFTDFAEFRDFLLVKLINGEKAAFNVPVFAQKRQRTLEMLIKNLYQDHMSENSKNNMLNRRAFSDLIPESVHGSRRKEEARQLEFLRIGQSLKLKTILKGDAPTSLITSGALLKHQPWEPQCFLRDFPHEIICGDSWGDKLIAATTVGTFVLEEGATPRMLFDRTVVIKQINVIEAHGLLLFRGDKGKENRIYVFRLTDFEGESNEDVIRTKTETKDHKLEKTKGCHMYSVSRPGGSHLRLVAAIGKKLVVLMWKHSSAWSAWCPSSDLEVVEGFQFLRELQSFEAPQVITLVDGIKGDNQICVGYKSQFDLINEKNGDTLQLYSADTPKTNIIAALDIYEDDEAELLLCYNHISHFQKLTEESSHEFDFYWNSAPQAIVCAFPYVLAFTPDTIEIRLIINGNLVHTMTMPDLLLITSKCDIFFASSAPDMMASGISPTGKGPDPPGSSPPPSPTSLTSQKSLFLNSSNIYKIPLTCLVGLITSDKSLQPPPSPLPQPQSLLSPLVSTPDRPRSPQPTNPKRSPLLRTKRLGPTSQLPPEAPKSRNCSNSSGGSDSGIHLSRLSETSPPESPLCYSLEDDVVG